MKKFFTYLKRFFVVVLGLLLILIGFGFWFKSLIEPQSNGLVNTSVEDLPYLSENIISERGKILIVVTSVNMMGDSGKATGYEMTELARAYYVFEANGFEVDIASTKGGKSPVVIDDDDMGMYDYAFLNDNIAQEKANNTIPMGNVKSHDYSAIYFAGGKGAMFDFPNNKKIQSLVNEFYETDKVIGAVCHGPAALVNVILDDGRPLLENKEISGFTNEEELLLVPEAKTIFPFLLQDKIENLGAQFNEGYMYLEKVSHEGSIITGQNPWSTWKTAELLVKQLGFESKVREKTGEENAVDILLAYHKKGLKFAKKEVQQILLEGKSVKRNLILQHAMVGIMQGEISDAVRLLRLASFVKKQYELPEE